MRGLLSAWGVAAWRREVGRMSDSVQNDAAAATASALAIGRRDRSAALLDECQTELWLLAHPESRHLRRVSAVYGHLSQQIALA